jgi:tetratricopeptide (TPR) repeat protein
VKQDRCPRSMDGKLSQGWLLILCAAVFGLWSSVYGQTPQTVQLTDIHHREFGTFTRLVFEFDGPVRHTRQEDWIGRNAVVLGDNARLGTRIRAGLYPISTAHVQSLEVQGEPGTGIRITLHTPDDFFIESVPLRDPHRIALDLKPAAGNVTAEGHLNRGIVYEQQGEQDNALQELRTAIKMRPGYPDAYFHAGVIRLMRGETRMAMINFGKVPANSPLGRETQKYILAAEQQYAAAVPANAQATRTTTPAPQQPNPVDVPLEYADDVEPEIYMHHQFVLDSVNPSKTLGGPLGKQSDMIMDTEIAMVDPAQPKPAAPSFFQAGSGFMNVSHMLRYWYAYGLATLLVIGTGFFMARKLFLRKPKKSKAKKQAALHPTYEKALKEEVAAGRMRVGSGQPRQFAKRLAQTYQMTDAVQQAATQPERKVVRKPVERNINRERHMEIEKALRENVTVEPTPKQRQQVGGFVPKEKYLAVYRLHDLGWSPTRIARQLNLGMEEVALALEMAPGEQTAAGETDVYRKARQMRRKGGDLTTLAREMNIGIGELEMAEQFSGKSRGGRR